MRRMVGVLVGLIAVAAVSPVAALDGSIAQSTRRGRLELIAQTVFIEATPAVVDVRVASDAADQLLEIRVYSPITEPDALRLAFLEPPDDAPISLFSRVPADLAVGVGDVISITIPDDEVGEILRQQPGALPVVIDLKENGVVVDTIVTALLVADRSTQPVDINLAFVADLRQPLAHAVNQSLPVDMEALNASLQTLQERQPPPTTIAFTPETLSALASMNDEAGTATLATVIEALGPHQMFATPWVDLDEEGWRQANEQQLVLDSYSLAQSVLEQHLDRPASAIARLDHDATDATISMLRTAGVAGVVVDPDQLSPVDRQRAVGQPLQVLDDNGVAMPMVAIAERLQNDLDRTDVELAAHQILSELVLLAASADAPRGFVVDLDTVNFSALENLIDKMAGVAGLNLSTVAEVLSLPPARTPAGSIIRARLVATGAPRLGADSTDLRLTEAVLNSYASMVAPADAPIAPLRTLLLASSASELDAESRRAYTNEVFASVAAGTSGFEVLESSRVTLASRTADLPVTIRNRQSLPITVILRVTSEKLRFPDGEQMTLNLDPGDNLITIRVETVASGDARLTARLTSPDGRLDLATGTIDIRSTAISGLGLVISVIALLVLGAWWARTILRIRRQRHAASVAASDADPA